MQIAAIIFSYTLFNLLFVFPACISNIIQFHIFVTLVNMKDHVFMGLILDIVLFLVVSHMYNNNLPDNRAKLRDI